MLINGLGAFATGVTLLVVLVAKFRDGAWITVILVPLLIVVMAGVKRHYDGVKQTIHVETPINLANLAEPLVIVPLDRWTRITEKGLRFALKISSHIEAVHVDAEDCSGEVWTMLEKNVVAPVRAAGLTPPELVVRHWWQAPLHNQRAQLLKVLLFFVATNELSSSIFPGICSGIALNLSGSDVLGGFLSGVVLPSRDCEHFSRALKGNHETIRSHTGSGSSHCTPGLRSNFWLA
jgi:hypothetical protein